MENAVKEDAWPSTHHFELLNSRYFRLKHRRTGTFGLGGGDFLARKIYAIPELVIVEIRIQTHSNCTKNNLVHNLPCGGKFFVEFNFADFGFQVSREKIANLDFRL